MNFLLAREARAIEQAVAATLGIVACIEIAEYSQQKQPDRPRERRAGRATLQRVLHRLGRDEDAQCVTFPSPGISLSHSGSFVVAAGIDSPVGFGIDCERRRAIDPRGARFFLDPREIERLATAIDRESALLRLWTIKEAVFKACLANRGSLLADYVLDDPVRTTGTARSRRDGSAFSYCSIEGSAGVLSVAVAD